MNEHDPTAPPTSDLDRLVDVLVDVTVELGRTRMTLGQALEIGPGAVIPLDRTAGSPLALKVNGQLVARGEVVVVDDVYGLRIAEIIQPSAQDAAADAVDAVAEPAAEAAPAPTEQLAA